MLATYLRVNPGRSKEIRTLQVFVESDDNSFDPSSFLHTNVIVFRKDKTVSLIENDFKTVQSAGPRNIDLSGDQELVYYLHQYNLARASLLRAKSHAHFFLNYSGEPFKDSFRRFVWARSFDPSFHKRTKAFNCDIFQHFRRFKGRENQRVF